MKDITIITLVITMLLIDISSTICNEFKNNDLLQSGLITYSSSNKLNLR